MIDPKAPVADDAARTDDLAEAVRQLDERLAAGADRFFRLADDMAAAGAPDAAGLARNLAEAFSAYARR